MEDKVLLTGQRLARLVASKILITEPETAAKLLSLDAGEVPESADTTAVHTFADKHRGTLGGQLEGLFTTELRDEPIRNELGRLCVNGCTGDVVDLLVSSVIGFHAVTQLKDQQDFGPVASAVASAVVDGGDYPGKLTTGQIKRAIKSLNDLGQITDNSDPEQVATTVIATMSLTCRLAD